MRGLACVLMFQTHCYDSWLGGAARTTNFIGWSRLGGTLPAPLFLFLAGISCALLTSRLRQKGVAPGAIARTTIRRGAEIFGLALLFRVQEFVLGRPWAPWTDLLRVDVLNVIGISLMLMGAVCWLARSSAANAILAAAVALGDRARHAAAVDHLAAALAAVVSRVVRQRRAHVQSAAAVALPDFPVDGVRIRGAGRRISPVQRMAVEESGASDGSFRRGRRRDIFPCPLGLTRVRCNSTRCTTTGTRVRTFFSRAWES